MDPLYEYTCRACLKTNHLGGFNEISDEVRELINRSCPVLVRPDDKLPQQLCDPCTTLCETWLNFTKHLIDNDRLLVGKRWKLNLMPEEEEEWESHDIKEEPQEEEEQPIEESEDKNADVLPDQGEIALDNSHLDGKRAVIPMCSPCDLSRTEDEDGYPPDLDGKGRFSCIYCGKSFPRLHHLTQHTRIHTGERPLKCDECNKTFNQKSNLKRHRFTHTRESAFSCGQCGRKFISKGTLVYHIKQVHTKERPFACEHCGKRFAVKGNLNVHLVVHMNERPFKCDLCDTSFKQRSHLTTHRKLHSEVRSFKCGECGKGFNRRNQLIAHERIHRKSKKMVS